MLSMYNPELFLSLYIELFLKNAINLILNGPVIAYKRHPALNDFGTRFSNGYIF